jgi:hypothetical protein
VTLLKVYRATAALPMLAVAMLLLTIPICLRGASAGVRLSAAAFRTPHSEVQQGASGNSPKPSGQQNGGDQPQTESAMHTITIQFDYDFTETSACSANVKATCVQKFSVYDISGGKPYFLFAVPVPQDAHGLMKGITATSPRMLFAVGKHRIGVSAQSADGKESAPRACKTIIEIKPESVPGPSAAP